MIDRASFTRTLLGSILYSAGSAKFRLGSNLSAPSDDNFDCDVAIVGGGISGVYTAWRLINAPTGSVRIDDRSLAEMRPLRVALFEGTGRIGGRLLSAQSPCLPDVPCELGGMRITDDQLLVSKLVRKLRLTPIRLNAETSFAFLRGRHIAGKDLSNPDAIPYELDGYERLALANGKDLMEYAVRTLIPETSDFFGDELYRTLQSATLDDEPLYQWGFWALLAQKLSSEAISFSRTMTGFDAFGQSANAVDLIMKVISFKTTAYYLINEGFERLPWTLQAEFAAKGGSIAFGQWLDSFEANGGGGVRLRFRSGLTVRAKAVVLAMPQFPLKKIFAGWPMPTVGGESILNSVESVQLFKAFLLYPTPWWKTCAGRAYSDTPIRQCWYWNSYQPCNAGDTKALIMVYCDMSSARFWESWRFPGVATSGPCARAKGDALTTNWANNAPPGLMVDELHRQLAIMHGQDPAKIPQPIDAAYKDWNDEPFGGAVHFWSQGFESWKITEAITHPIPGVPCYVCGEAYSTKQAWVEGALKTAEHLLQTHFGLAALS